MAKRQRQSFRPDVIAQEIVDDLQAALAQFGEIASDLNDKARAVLIICSIR